MISSTIDAVRRQNFQSAYIYQMIPVLGAVISIPTAMVSGLKAVAKIAQEIFQRIKDFTFGSNEKPNAKSGPRPIDDAKDLALIFTNNVLNIATLGIMNSIIIHGMMRRYTEDLRNM